MKKISITLALLLSSCATGTTLKEGAVAGGKVVANCAKESVVSKASQIFPAILAILASPGDTWKEQVDMYGVKYSQEVALCAARAAVDKLTTPVQSEALAADPEAVKRTATTRLRQLELEAVQ